MHVSKQMPGAWGGLGGGRAFGGGGGLRTRGPQSVQSVPRAQLRNSEPGQPSSQSPSEAQTHVSKQMPGARGGLGGDGGGGGALGGGGGLRTRGPQSVQSVP